MPRTTLHDQPNDLISLVLPHSISSVSGCVLKGWPNRPTSRRGNGAQSSPIAPDQVAHRGRVTEDIDHSRKYTLGCAVNGAVAAGHLVRRGLTKGGEDFGPAGYTADVCRSVPISKYGTGVTTVPRTAS